jgi:hypothetical protein
MTRPASASNEPHVDPRLANTLWQWLALGVLALCLVPGWRGSTAWLGWGPYWLVAAPLIALAVAHRGRWLAPRDVAQHAAEDTTTAHRRRPRGARAQQAQRAIAARRGRHLRVA